MSSKTYTITGTAGKTVPKDSVTTIQIQMKFQDLDPTNTYKMCTKYDLDPTNTYKVNGIMRSDFDPTNTYNTYKILITA